MNDNVYIQVVIDQDTKEYKFNLSEEQLRKFILWMDSLSEAMK